MTPHTAADALSAIALQAGILGLAGLLTFAAALVMFRRYDVR